MFLRLLLACFFVQYFCSQLVRAADTTTLKPSSTTQCSGSDIENLQQEIDELAAEVEELKAIAESNQEAIANITDQASSEISNLHHEIDELEDDISDIVHTINVNNAEPLCQDYLEAGVTESGYYQIDPDGENGIIAPFEVYCDFDSDPELAITKIGHDSENRTLVDGCEDPGCYSKNISYVAEMEQIVAVMAKSESCRQYLKYECRDSMLFNYEDEFWWKARNGTNQYYFGGAPLGSRMCRCAVEGNCDLNSTSCSCDNNDPVWRQDDGYFTDFDTLPVSQLNFGDTESLHELGYHTLGKLECQGRAMRESCAQLKLQGFLSGNYTINPSPLVIDDFDVYCDMESYPGTGVTVIHHNASQELTSVNDYSTCAGSNIYVDYGVSMDRIEALINISDKCTQYIYWRCYRTGMLRYGGSYWVSRDGERMNYWGGATPGHDGYCGCGEDGSCGEGADVNDNCNCDYYASSSLWAGDGGLLVDKRKLPVTRMYYGFYYCSSSYYGKYTLGPLKCF